MDDYQDLHVKIDALTAENAALKAELAQHVKPASEPPNSYRDIMVLVDGIWRAAWYSGDAQQYLMYDEADTLLEHPAACVSVTPLAWKEIHND